MAELKLTALQNRFLLAIVEGKSPMEAIKAARGPRGNKVSDSRLRHQASEMMRDCRVQQALARVRDAAIEAAQLRVEDLVSQLMEARQVAFACDPPQLSAAVAATMGAGKLLGLVIDRSEIQHLRNKPAPVPTKALELDETEWRRLFDPSKK